MSSIPEAPPPDVTGQARWRFADVEFDEAENKLRVGGKPVVIEPRPLRLLQELLRHVNEVVTKEELLDGVWEGRPTVDHVLANAVSKLRTALGDVAATRIVTVPRMGYKLAGPVQRVEVRVDHHTFQAGQEVPGREGYRLERPLGQGSRSDVWLARHGKLGQAHVFKFADDGARLSALKREYTLYRVLRQELGQRDDIATVVDTNFSIAPYFLECVYGGQNLLEWAEGGAQPRLAAMPLGDRLALFLQIARAVAAAHSVGVLHKDLKPGNVLIDGEDGRWQARLTDFGSGRLLDDARLAGLQLTAMGMTQTQDASTDSRSGTLMYMAPEVITGQSPSTQSDVYALGLILYQMLVADLGRPLSTGWQRDIDDLLLVEDVTAATEGAPQARIAGVADLVERLETLPDRHAQRDERLRQAERIGQVEAELRSRQARRPWVAGAWGLLLLGLVSTLIFYEREREALGLAVAQARRADATIDFLTHDVLTADDITASGGRKPATVLEVLERGSANVSARFAGQPVLEARMRRHLSLVHQRLFNNRRAWTELDAALALMRSRPDTDDHLLDRLLLDSVLLNVAMLYTKEAAAAMEEVDRRSEGALAAGSTPLALHYQRARAALLLQQGKVDDALAAAASLSERLNADSSASLDERFEAMRMHAEVLIAHGDFAQAASVIAQLSKPPFGVARVGEGVFTGAAVRVGTSLMKKGRFDQARPVLMGALATLEQQRVPSLWHSGIVNNMLGQVAEAQGDFEEAALRTGKALDSLRSVLGDAHENTQAAELNLATAQLHLAHWQDALSLCESVRERQPIKPPAGSQKTLNVIAARALIGLQRPKEALAVLSSAASDGKWQSSDALQDDFDQIGRAFKGMALIDLGRVDEGKALIAATLRELKPSGVPSPAFEKSWERYMQRTR